MPWKVISQSVIGTLHKECNMPCQDFCRVHLLLDNEVVVGAVADGAGSAEQAETGAQSAVNTAIEYLSRKLPELITSENTVPAISQADIQVIGNMLIGEVRTTLQHAAVQLDCPLKELACTLVAFIATPQWAMALQVGDSFLIIREHNKTNYKLVFLPDRGEFVNETCFVTSEESSLTVQCTLLSERLDFICACTDGLESVAIQHKDWTPHTPFFQPLEHFVAYSSNLSEHLSYLTNFLASEKLNSKTRDDKTILLCTYNPNAG